MERVDLAKEPQTATLFISTVSPEQPSVPQETPEGEKNSVEPEKGPQPATSTPPPEQSPVPQATSEGEKNSVESEKGPQPAASTLPPEQLPVPQEAQGEENRAFNAIVEMEFHSLQQAIRELQSDREGKFENNTVLETNLEVRILSPTQNAWWCRKLF